MNRTTNRSNFTVQATLLVALALTSRFSSAAADKAAIREPGKTPSRIVLTWADVPTRTQAVTWRTDTPVASPQAQIAPLTPKPKFQDSTLTVKGTAAPVALPEGKSATQYAVRFQDLKPATKYAYRVGDGSTWSEWNVFQTASTRADPFRFIYLGDAQNSIHSLWSRTIRTAFATAPDARFMIHAGDLVADGFDDSLWGEWCEALGFISAMVPSLPVPGNHDLHHDTDATEASDPLLTPPSWGLHFALPMNGPEALRGQAYYLDYQGARFISLDSNAFGGDIKPNSDKLRVADQEIVWLEKVLRDNPNRWTIVFSHYPVYPIANQRTRFLQMESRLVPLYEKYHVDLVLQGHDHGYGRTHKLRAGTIVSDMEAGTIYAVSVSGTKMYEVAPPAPTLFAKTLAGSQLFQVVSVSQARLLFQAYTIDGTVIDSFELRKALGSGKGE
jgi:3',5'-cyclic AMP phosphodiesterase CpdA